MTQATETVAHAHFGALSQLLRDFADLIDRKPERPIIHQDLAGYLGSIERPRPAVPYAIAGERQDGELFRLAERDSGKLYRIFDDGRTEGFAPGTVLVNYYRGASKRAQASDSPNTRDAPSRGGGSQGDAP